MIQIDEEIHLEEYNPKWKEYYKNEKSRLLKTIGRSIIKIEQQSPDSELPDKK